MNATELFTKNKISSVSDSNAIGAGLSYIEADTASLYTINDLLLALTDTLKNKHRTNVQISPSEPELLGTPFSFNAENALELLRDICNFAGRRGDAVYIDVYEKDMHIFYDVYTLSSHDEQEENEQSNDDSGNTPRNDPSPSVEACQKAQNRIVPAPRRQPSDVRSPRSRPRT